MKSIDDNKSTKQEKQIFVFLVILLTSIVISLIYVNITAIMSFVYSDMVNEIEYKRLVWETKNILPPNWYHPHELLSSRILFFYLIAYALTQNIIISQQISIILGMILQLFCLTYILKILDLKRNSILFALCFYLTLNPIADLLYVRFDAYSWIPCMVFLTLGIKISLEKQWRGFKSLKDKKNVLKLLFLFITSIYIGYGSPKLAIILYIPILMTESVLYFKNFGLKEKITLNNKLFSIILTFLLLTLNLIAYIILLKIGANFTPIGLNIAKLNNQLDWSNISIQLQSLLLSMGLYMAKSMSSPLEFLYIEPSISSPSGLLYLISITVIFVVIVSTFYSIKYSENEFIKMIGLYFIFTTIIMFMYLLVSATSMLSVRYFVSTTIMFSVLIAIGLDVVLKIFFWWSKPMLFLMCMSIIFAQMFHVHNYASRQPNKSFEKIAQYMLEENYNIVTGDYWTVGALRAYSNGNIKIRQYLGQNSFIPFLWLTDKSVYGQEFKNEPNILLIDDIDESKMLEDEQLKLILDDGEKLIEIDKYNLYKYNRNILPVIDFPTKSNENHEYYLEEWPIQFQKNTYKNKDNKSIISGSTEGFFYGPYIQVNKGIYDVTLYYNVISSVNDEVGTFKIQANGGSDILKTELIKSNLNQVCLKDVVFNETKSSVELVGIANVGNIIEFEKIIITKK